MPRPFRFAVLLFRRHRLLRFLLVGGVNTLFGYTIFAAAYVLTGDHRLAVAASIVLGVLFNFVTTGRIVFGSRSGRALIPFILAYVFALVLNVVLLDLLLRIGLNAFVGQALCLPVVVVTAYLINARFVFRPAAQS